MIAISIVIVGCTGPRPTISEWNLQTWAPLRASVPAVADATPEICEESLVEIRDQIQSDSAAPDPELQEAFEKWSEAAQSLTFECASEAEDFSYADTHAEVERLSEAVDRIVEESD
ncbi:MAG: hypothetical protein OEM39_09530 [Acidimicrobiia bacterium]|nr:hypothetical protein [Acidimicrobiia bacterium]